MSKDQQAQHPAVASVTTGRRPPVLAHKASIIEPHDVDQLHLHGLAGGRHPHELTLVRCCDLHACNRLGVCPSASAARAIHDAWRSLVTTRRRRVNGHRRTEYAARTTLLSSAGEPNAERHIVAFATTSDHRQMRNGEGAAEHSDSGRVWQPGELCASS